MFPRIDLGEVGRVLLYEMKVGRSNDPRVILERRIVSDVVDAHPHTAALIAVDVSRPRLWLRLCCLGCLASRGPFGAGASARGHTSQCSSLFQEPPAARTIGIHDCLP